MQSKLPLLLPLQNNRQNMTLSEEQKMQKQPKRRPLTMQQLKQVKLKRREQLLLLRLLKKKPWLSKNQHMRPHLRKLSNNKLQLKKKLTARKSPKLLKPRRKHTVHPWQRWKK